MENKFRWRLSMMLTPLSCAETLCCRRCNITVVKTFVTQQLSKRRCHNERVQSTIASIIADAEIETSQGGIISSLITDSKRTKQTAQKNTISSKAVDAKITKETSKKADESNLSNRTDKIIKQTSQISKDKTPSTVNQKKDEDTILSVIKAAKIAKQTSTRAQSSKSRQTVVQSVRSKPTIIQAIESESIKAQSVESKQTIIASESDIAHSVESEPTVAQSYKTEPTRANIKSKQKLIVIKSLDSLTDEKADILANVKMAKLFREENENSDKADRDQAFKEYIGSLGLKNLPSVTKVIQATMTNWQKYVLEKWKNKMISELGGDGFAEYQQETFKKGSNFHGSVYKKLDGESDEHIQVMPNTEGYWKSVQLVFPKLEHVHAMEETITHPDLLYKGVFDCIAVYRGTVCVIDWKTSSKPKPMLKDTYDNPVQLAAYIGALNQSDFLINRQIPFVTNAALVVAYENGDPAHIHFMDKAKCDYYWKKWLDKLHQYFIQESYR